jgi:ribonuclease HI
MYKIYIHATTSQITYGNKGIYGYSVFNNKDEEIDYKTFLFDDYSTTNGLLLKSLLSVLERFQDKYPFPIEIYSNQTYIVNGYNKGFKKLKANEVLWKLIFKLKKENIKLVFNNDHPKLIELINEINQSLFLFDKP